MAMPSPRWRTVLVAAALLALVALSAGSINALPLFSNDTGPTDIDVVSLERLDAGCEDEIATYASSHNGPNGTYRTTSFIETGSVDADLAAHAERTSHEQADFSTFRVYVESYRDGPANETCDVGIQYRLEVQTSGGSDGGLLPDASGVRVLFLENGRFSGCSSAGSGPYSDGGCNEFLTQPPTRTWANASR